MKTSLTVPVPGGRALVYLRVCRTFTGLGLAHQGRSLSIRVLQGGEALGRGGGGWAGRAGLFLRRLGTCS